MTANPVTMELQHLSSPLNSIKMNLVFLNPELEQKATPGLNPVKSLLISATAIFAQDVKFIEIYSLNDFSSRNSWCHTEGSSVSASSDNWHSSS